MNTERGEGCGDKGEERQRETSQVAQVLSEQGHRHQAHIQEAAGHLFRYANHVGDIKAHKHTQNHTHTSTH